MPHRRGTITPRRVRRILFALCAVSGVTEVGILAVWFTGGVAADPHIFGTLAHIFIVLCAVTGCTAAVVHCHIVVSYAFAAGVRYAQQVGQIPDPTTVQPRARLTVVE